MRIRKLEPLFARLLLLVPALSAGAVAATACGGSATTSTPDAGPSPTPTPGSGCENWNPHDKYFSVPAPPRCDLRGDAAPDSAGGDGGSSGDAGPCLATGTDGKPLLDCSLLCLGGTGGAADCALATEGGTDIVACHSSQICPGGRRFEGLEPCAPIAATDIGLYFATLFHLEAASVDAFLVLADELARLGAPRRLVRAARSAARDERCHAALILEICQRHGVSPVPPSRPRVRHRSLEEIATENAVEGCVNETYGALLAHHQARHAAEPELRTVMARISRDETRHAELSWSVARWAESVLDAVAVARVHAARDQAAQDLAAGLGAHAPSQALLVTIGLPPAQRAQRLFTSMYDALRAA